MLISVITPTFNSEKTLEQCILSVNSQSYSNREHIIIDGKSTDNTLGIILNNKSLISKYLTEDDSGIYDALNKGINISNGDIIGVINSDDIYADNSILQKVADVFMSDSSICAVYGNLNYVRYDNISRVIRKWESSNFNKYKLRFGWMPPHPTLFIKRSWYDKVGGYDITYKISADYNLVLNLFGNNDFHAIHLDYLFVKMRVGGLSNGSISNILLKSTEDFKALRSNEFNYISSLIALILKNISKIFQFFK
jgi:glycosyltransferase involved in cell wall biosynthesis